MASEKLVKFRMSQNIQGFTAEVALEDSEKALRELFESARRAGARQHRGARAGMIQSVGGVSNESYVFIVDQT